MGKSMRKPPGCWLHDSSYISNFVRIFKISIFHTLQCRFSCCLVTKLRLTLCNPMDYGPPDSSVHGIFQTRKSLVIPLPFPSSGDLPDPETESVSSASSTLQVDHLPTDHIFTNSIRRFPRTTSNGNVKSS